MKKARKVQQPRKAAKHAGARSPEVWQLQDAKAHFSLLFSRAVDEKKPQSVSRRGKDRVVIVDAQEYERATRPSGTMAEFFMTSPLRESGLTFERAKDKAREIDL